jgi:hypothetical protein
MPPITLGGVINFVVTNPTPALRSANQQHKNNSPYWPLLVVGRGFAHDCGNDADPDGAVVLGF